jgi:hypothetical protein
MAYELPWGGIANFVNQLPGRLPKSVTGAVGESAMPPDVYRLVAGPNGAINNLLGPEHFAATLPLAQQSMIKPGPTYARDIASNNQIANRWMQAAGRLGSGVQSIGRGIGRGAQRGATDDDRAFKERMSAIEHQRDLELIDRRNQIEDDKKAKTAQNHQKVLERALERGDEKVVRKEFDWLDRNAPELLYPSRLSPPQDPSKAVELESGSLLPPQTGEYLPNVDDPPVTGNPVYRQEVQPHAPEGTDTWAAQNPIQEVGYTAQGLEPEFAQADAAEQNEIDMGGGATMGAADSLGDRVNKFLSKGKLKPYDIYLPEGEHGPAGNYKVLVTPDGEVAKVIGQSKRTGKTASPKDKVHAGMSNTLAEMAGHYADLHKMGGLFDPNEGALDRNWDRIRGKYDWAENLASGLPGELGKTYAQEREIRTAIESIRPKLVNFIRKAEEMGAKGMDSEKELEFFLKQATDPSVGWKTNFAAIRRLDEAYGDGSVIPKVLSGNPDLLGELLTDNTTLAKTLLQGVDVSEPWALFPEGDPRANPSSWRQK